MPNVIAVDFFGSQSPSNQMADRSFSNSLVLRVPANSWAPFSSRERQPRLLQSRGVSRDRGLLRFLALDPSWRVAGRRYSGYREPHWLRCHADATRFRVCWSGVRCLRWDLHYGVALV